ncbi:MAG: chemotaxis protein CheX [Desulfuromonadales bacterium]|nr:chemotaxis protein CheX [Desulfuromonadales bacterium]
MAIKFFGQFLIDKKIISKLELLDAIELQEKNNLRFGDLIIKMGLMKQEQRNLILEAQRHEDLQFGEMAVQLGILSPAQVQQVLDKQRSEHLFIGEALVKLRFISNKQLERCLVDFKQSQNTTANTGNKIIIPDGVCHRPIWEIVTDMTCKMLTRIAGVTLQTGLCTVTNAIPPRPLAIKMELSGLTSASLLLTVSAETIAYLANALLKRDINGTETAHETVKNFVDIIGSNIVCKAAHFGYSIAITEAEISPQDNAKLNIPNEHNGLLLPIHFSDGETLELIIIQKDD